MKTILILAVILMNFAQASPTPSPTLAPTQNICSPPTPSFTQIDDPSVDNPVFQDTNLCTKNYFDLDPTGNYCPIPQPYEQSQAAIFNFTSINGGVYQFDTWVNNHTFNRINITEIDTIMMILDPSTCNILACNDDLGLHMDPDHPYFAGIFYTLTVGQNIWIFIGILGEDVFGGTSYCSIERLTISQQGRFFFTCCMM